MRALRSAKRKNVVVVVDDDDNDDVDAADAVAAADAVNDTAFVIPFLVLSTVKSKDKNCKSPVAH